MGMGDISPSQYTNPPLTTIRVCTCELGARGMALALDLASGLEPSGLERVLPTEIVERQSVAMLSGSEG